MEYLTVGGKKSKMVFTWLKGVCKAVFFLKILVGSAFLCFLPLLEATPPFGSWAPSFVFKAVVVGWVFFILQHSRFSDYIVTFSLTLLSPSFTIYLLTGCAGSLLLHTGFLYLWRAGATLKLQLSGFSLQWFLLLQSSASRVSKLSNWCMRLIVHGMWYLPGPGIKLVSSALQGRFLTTVPPGKPSLFHF